MSSPVVEAMLDDVLGLIATRRRRTPVEAPPHLTGGYALLIVAVGFARVGLDARARVVWDQALTSFGDVRRDPVHAWLTDAYGMRIAHAIARLSPRYAWTDELIARFATLTRLESYKVNRLRESSPSLDAKPPDGFDAIEQHDQHAVVPDASTLRAAAPPSVAEIAASLAGEPSTAALDALVALDEPTAIDLIARLGSRASELSQPTLAAAIGVAARFGFAELVPPLFAAVTSAELPLVRALCRIGMRDELARFDSLPARAALGDPALAAEMPQLIADLTRLLTGGALPQVRRYAAAYSTSSKVRDDMRRLYAYWAHASDAFGTNSHFTLAVLHVVDSLVSAIVDHYLLSLSPRDGDPAVAWPYLL